MTPSLKPGCGVPNFTFSNLCRSRSVRTWPEREQVGTAVPKKEKERGGGGGEEEQQQRRLEDCEDLAACTEVTMCPAPAMQSTNR